MSDIVKHSRIIDSTFEDYGKDPVADERLHEMLASLPTKEYDAVKLSQEGLSGTSEFTKLTPRQRLFCRTFVRNGSASLAYFEVFRCPRNQSSHRVKRLLANQTIRNYIAYLQTKQEAALLNEVKREWMKTRAIRREIAYAKTDDVFDFTGEEIKLKKANEIPPAARRAIRKVRITRKIDSHGDTTETVDVQLAAPEPHLSALEDRYAVMPKLDREPQRIDVTTGGKPLASSAMEENREEILSILAAVSERAKAEAIEIAELEQ